MKVYLASTGHFKLAIRLNSPKGTNLSHSHMCQISLFCKLKAIPLFPLLSRVRWWHPHFKWVFSWSSPFALFSSQTWTLKKFWSCAPFEALMMNLMPWPVSPMLDVSPYVVSWSRSKIFGFLPLMQKWLDLLTRQVILSGDGSIVMSLHSPTWLWCQIFIWALDDTYVSSLGFFSITSYG